MLVHRRLSRETISQDNFLKKREGNLKETTGLLTRCLQLMKVVHEGLNMNYVCIVPVRHYHSGLILQILITSYKKVD